MPRSRNSRATSLRIPDVVLEVLQPVETEDLRVVVVALHELRLERDPLLLDGEDDAIDEGQRLAAVVEQPGAWSAGSPSHGYVSPAKFGLRIEDVAPVLLVLGQHVRPGADRPVVERQVLLGESRLRVELVGFPRNRGGEHHRQPVLELRVLAVEPHAQRVVVERLHAGQVELPEVEEGQVAAGRIEPGAQLLVELGHLVAVLLQPDHVVGEGRERRRLDARGGQALERVHVVVRGQLARARVLEVEGGALVGRLLARQRVVQVVAAGVPARTPGAARTGFPCGSGCRRPTPRSGRPACRRGARARPCRSSAARRRRSRRAARLHTAASGNGSGRAARRPSTCTASRRSRTTRSDRGTSATAPGTP